jgi:DNA modification methylase
LRIINGDCREVLKSLPCESVHCCITSPPYLGLRDYGAAVWEGGDPGCDHGVRRWEGPKQTQGAQSSHASVADRLNRRQCACGAKRTDNPIGLEDDPSEYIQGLVEVFREVRRVLRKDGTFWLNLGDTFAANRGYQVPDSKHTFVGNGHGSRVPEGLKTKDLMMIPHRAALALQADGWWVRSDIVWSKGNPMPESVRDRPTRAHEYVFLLTKSDRYWYDAAAVREPAVSGHSSGNGFKRPASLTKQDKNGARGSDQEWEVTEYRNQRSVWSVNTKPFKGAHFAVFPAALVEPCLLAGCPVGGTVLDPFAGSGTVGEVANKHGRDAILIELNPEYIKLIEKRVGLA